MRPWLRRASYGMAFGTAVALAVPVAWLFPYFRDDYVLDGVVRAVALDWRDFGREKAQARLEYELDHRGIGMWVGDDDCRLVTDDRGDGVTCSWVVAIEVPVADLVLPLGFRSTAWIDQDGNLRP